MRWAGLQETHAVHPIFALPPSSTGMQGYISLETLQLVRELRRASTVFVIISGARYSTVIERLPYLPFVRLSPPRPRPRSRLA